MIEHNDDAYVMMLLTMPLSPMSDGALDPLTADEFAAVASRMEAANAPLQRLLGEDVDGLRRLLDVEEEYAYRLGALLSRQLILGRLIEECLMNGTEILTPFDSPYPKRVRRRMGTYLCPVLFLKGNPDLLSAPSIGVCGISGIKTTSALRSGLNDLVTRAALSGYGLVTGAEAGACRLAMGFALENEGRLSCVLTGGFDDFTEDSGHAYAIKSGNMAVISPAHPAAKPNALLLSLRNRLIFALSRAAFVVTSDGKRSEAELVRKKLCDNAYLFTDPAFPLNAALRQKGFTEIEDLSALDIKEQSRHWEDTGVEQISFL